MRLQNETRDECVPGVLFCGNNKTRDVLASRVLSVKRKVAFAWLCFEGLLLVSLRDSIISMKGEVSTNFAIIITND